MEIYTIGFTKKTAAQFFGLLRNAHIKRLIDIRLNNSSQLAGFSKQPDLEFFLRELCGADYLHEPRLAPTQPLLDAYKKQGGSWPAYASAFRELMRERRVEACIDRQLFNIPAVLLCSEATADYCHRRLVAEYFAEHWGDIQITHL